MQGRTFFVLPSPCCHAHTIPPQEECGMWRYGASVNGHYTGPGKYRLQEPSIPEPHPSTFVEPWMREDIDVGVTGSRASEYNGWVSTMVDGREGRDTYMTSTLEEG